MHGLLRAPEKRRGQHKNSLSILREWGLAWCRRVIDHAKDWDLDDLINLFTAGMLRMTPEERLSASVCLTKGCDLGLFDGHSLDLRSATLSSPSNGDDYDSQLGSFGTGFDHRGSNVQSPVDHLYPLEAGSKCLGGYERRRSGVVGSANKSFSRERIKCGPSENRLTQIPISRTDRVSDHRLEHQGQSNQFCMIYDTVLALLTDLLGSKSQDIDIDDRTRTLIEELSEYLAPA